MRGPLSADAASPVEISFERTPYRLADGPADGVRFSADAAEVLLTALSRSQEWIEAEARLTAEQAHALSRLDEDYQARIWGRDDEADAAARRRLAAMQDAERFWKLSRAD